MESLLGIGILWTTQELVSAVQGPREAESCGEGREDRPIELVDGELEEGGEGEACG